MSSNRICKVPKYTNPVNLRKNDMYHFKEIVVNQMQTFSIIENTTNFELGSYKQYVV